jgi:hypothetical protein
MIKYGGPVLCKILNSAEFVKYAHKLLVSYNCRVYQIPKGFCLWCGNRNNFKFNVFHARALYYTKTLITNKCTKRVLSSIVTRSYMFRPWWVIFREKIVTLRLHFIVEWECAVDCVLRCFWRRELSAVRACTAVQAGSKHVGACYNWW